MLSLLAERGFNISSRSIRFLTVYLVSELCPEPILPAEGIFCHRGVDG